MIMFAKDNRVYQLRYKSKFSIFMSVEWMWSTWIMGSESKFFKVVVCASSIWFDNILFNLYYTVHSQPAKIITFSSASYWWLTSPDFPCTCIFCGCFRWWRHRWFCCKVAESKRRGTSVHARLRVIEFRKNWSHVACTSDIFGWNLSTKNVDIYCIWYTLIRFLIEEIIKFWHKKSFGQGK